MKKIIFIILFWSLLPFFSMAAPSEDEEDVKDLPVRERIFVGGYIGLQFGTITSINISPTIGYRITNRLSAGLGGTYQYYRDRGWLITSDFAYSTHIFGGSLFTRYFIIPQVFAHVEMEALNLDTRIDIMQEAQQGRFWEQNYFVGGGYRQSLGPRTFLNLMLLYNLNQNSVIHYQNPVFRFGLDVRL